MFTVWMAPVVCKCKNCFERHSISVCGMVTSPNKSEIHQDLYLPSIQQTVMTTCPWQLFVSQKLGGFSTDLRYPSLECCLRWAQHVLYIYVEYVYIYAEWIHHLLYKCQVQYRIYEIHKYEYSYIIFVSMCTREFMYIHVSCIMCIYTNS